MFRAGVASAVNDVTREVGGALGIAVLGSIIGSRFASAMAKETPAEIRDALPAELSNRLGESIGVSNIVADALPADLAAQFQEIVQRTFSDAVSVAYLVAAIIIFCLTLTVGRSVPKEGH